MKITRLLSTVLMTILFLASAPTIGLVHASEAPTDFANTLTEEERAFLAQIGVVRVHNESDWAPFNFNQNGVPKGFSIDYIKLLAQKTGLILTFISGPTWDEFLEMAKKGELDIMLNIAASEERRQFLEFTPPYVTMLQMIYTRKDFPRISSIKDLYGKRFAVPKGYYLHQVLKAHPQIEIIEANNTMEAIRAFSVGRADALFDLMPVVDYITREMQITNLKVGGDPGLGEGKPIPLHIAVRKDWKILAGILEKGMMRITDQELEKLHDKWMTRLESEKEEFVLTEAEKRWLAAHKKIRLG
ncbi:MAG: transporter substrate-binding domain-containing protein, partial [Deltaproteobacteria bacterium]|nr:transporter substrate-binding domain-containing protein [Deltaproteobacteria bacterium]